MIRQKEKYLPVVLILPAIIMMYSIIMYPLVYSVYISFTSFNVQTPEKTAFVGLGNYVEAFNDPELWNAIKNTFIYVSTAVGVELSIGLGLALLFLRERKERSAIRTILIMPMTLTPVVAGLIWRILLTPEVGALNYYQSQVGLSYIAWLYDPSYALITTILVDIWQWTPFVFLVLSAALSSLPSEPFEAAKLDGASRLQIFRHVTLPLLRSALLVVLLFRIIESFKVYDTIYMLTRGGPGIATENLSYFIYRIGFLYFRMGYAAALSQIMLLIVTFVTLLLIRFLYKEVA